MGERSLAEEFGRSLALGMEVEETWIRDYWSEVLGPLPPGDATDYVSSLVRPMLEDVERLEMAVPSLVADILAVLEYSVALVTSIWPRTLIGKDVEPWLPPVDGQLARMRAAIGRLRRSRYARGLERTTPPPDQVAIVSAMVSDGPHYWATRGTIEGYESWLYGNTPRRSQNDTYRWVGSVRGVEWDPNCDI